MFGFLLFLLFFFILLPLVVDAWDSRRVYHWMRSISGKSRRRLRQFAQSHGLKVTGSHAVGEIEGRHIRVAAEPGRPTTFTAELATPIDHRLRFFCEAEIEPNDLLVSGQTASYWTGTSAPFVKLLKDDIELRILFSKLTRDFLEIELSPNQIIASGHFTERYDFDRGFELIDELAQALESRATS